MLFDRDALTPGKLKTQAVRLRFADGTLIDSDVSDVLPLACDLRARAEERQRDCLLALPLAHGNGGNLGQGEQTERPLRYRQEWQRCRISTAVTVKIWPLSVMRCPCALPHDNNQDYITCPLARLVRDVQATGHRMRAIFRRYWRLTPMTGWYSVWTHCCCSYGRSASV